ncbi:MAG: S-layer homology domain-containing protein [Bacillota bacterium]|nr:S-layer homology domain-containing protein [Bacillota bacterium]
MRTGSMKLLAIFLAAVMIISSISITAMAEETEETPGEASYTVENEDTVKLITADFDTACAEATNESLSYIQLALPSSTYGTLWYDFDSEDASKVSDTIKYYKSSASYKTIGKICFVPKSSFTGTLQIDYKGYNTKGASFNGTIDITVTKSTNVGDLDKITYNADSGDNVTLDASDINLVCRNEGLSLSYVKLTLPDPSAGVLYYNYKSSTKYDSKVKNTNKYYKSSSSSSAYLIDNVSFVPAEGCSSEIEITYTAYDSDDVSYTGIIRIKYTKDSSELSYTVDDNYVEFVSSDFNNICKRETGATLDYVKFTLPQTGTLYYDYSEEENAKTTVKSSTKYYYKSDPYLFYVSYVPKLGYSGTVQIEYTSYSVDGDYYNGVITVKVKSSGSSTGTADSISYSVKNSSYKTFSVTDFSNVCSDLTDETLDYVKFDIPSSSYGTLYYQYSSSKSYDSKVSASTKYYRSSSDYIKYVSFVPKSSYDGTVTISYTGYTTSGDYYTGKIKISVTDNGDSNNDTDDSEIDTITYTTEKGDSVILNGSDFNSVCRSYLGDTLDYVNFSNPSNGTLYYAYGEDDEKEITSSYECYYKGDDPLISDISFVPKSSYTGTVTINYKATSVDDETFKGIVKVTVKKNSDDENGMDNFSKGKKYKGGMFKDVDEDEWYGTNKNGSVKLVYSYGLMEGNDDGTFNPQGNITIAQAITIAARVANIYYNDEEDFEYEDKWYEGYVKYAISKNIIDENDFDDYDAFITRDQMAYIFSNILPDDELEEINEVKGIPDVDKYDEYYKEIIFLYNVGILSGSDSKGTFNPKSNITRAEVAAIITRLVDSSQRRTNKF